MGEVCMKRCFETLIVVSLLLGFSLVAHARGSEMTITYKDGNSQTVRLDQESGNIETIRFSSMNIISFRKNLVTNGSFEAGPVVGRFRTIKAGSQELQGWVITGTSIDIVGSLWRHSDGNRSVDLDGTPGTGGIVQLLNTAPGSTYSVSFDLAGNPDCGDPVKRLTVKAAGQHAEFDFNTRGKDHNNMGWQRKSWTFHSRRGATRLEFLSMSSPGSSCGAVIDNVVVSLSR